MTLMTYDEALDICIEKTSAAEMLNLPSVRDALAGYFEGDIQQLLRKSLVRHVLDTLDAALVEGPVSSTDEQLSDTLLSMYSEKQFADKFTVTRKDLYSYDRPVEVTRARLQQLAALGVAEVGTAEFGIRDVFGGLYVESVWRLTPEEWHGTLQWILGLMRDYIK